MTTVVIRPPRDASGRTVVARRGLGLACLVGLACLRGYATGTTIVPPERVDPAFVLFRYDRDSATWRALVAGTDAICTDLVPADVIPRLPGCLGS
ncbi:hypothetical protein [Plantactinospora sp. BB1]|uniref:hypothetical protein n=1 Tax=Plantactinospora sp. BB1 TaxID=2071627 RepID=UPI00131F02D7|nr:hypothetical protein [Plantactinospora sp. BB1]